MPTLSSPNGVVWEYYSSLREAVFSSRQAQRREQARRHAAQAVIMAVTVVEVFFNVWFRVRVGESPNPAHRTELEDHFKRRVSLERKLKDWPEKFLGKKLDLAVGAGNEFSKLKSRRNSIVHFTSSHEVQNASRLPGSANGTDQRRHRN